jgi:competence protein ComGF
MKSCSKNTDSSKLSAFTILEVTIVMALMSIIITIVTVAINRFNEQMKNNATIQQELNDFYAFRSNLWNELYSADSINYNNKIVSIYTADKIVEYTIEDELLARKNGNEWIKTAFPMLELREDFKKEDKIISFIFDWKGEPMNLHYLCKSSIKSKIDTYFDNYEQ